MIHITQSEVCRAASALRSLALTLHRTAPTARGRGRVPLARRHEGLHQRDVRTVHPLSLRTDIDLAARPSRTRSIAPPPPPPPPHAACASTPRCVRVRRNCSRTNGSSRSWRWTLTWRAGSARSGGGPSPRDARANERRALVSCRARSRSSSFIPHHSHHNHHNHNHRPPAPGRLGLTYHLVLCLSLSLLFVCRGGVHINVGKAQF
jgi:hypothetical protein